MKIVSCGAISVWVYDAEHGPPHCHVKIKGKKTISVQIDTLQPMYPGQVLDKNARRLLEENIEKIMEVWDNKHPKRKKR